ncbi:MAG TPA: extradiol ring-cleavage dioxygenase [Streptosporangiaceae bacterium]|nr:extradiol ring-cleavage dioxygenase [Streptosporangiaceae bacterium]
MSELVAVVGVQHNPLLWRTLADPREPDLVALRDEFAAASARLLATRPDTLVVIGTDHLTQWFYENMPSFLIGKAPVIPATFASEQREFGITPHVLAGDVPLATWLLGDGLTRDIDFSCSDEFRADHSILVPLRFLTPGLDIPIVPVFTNCMAPPLPRAERFYALGQVIRASLDACQLPRRVAVIASGHLATEVGGPRHFRGSPDPAFDDAAVATVAAGYTGDLVKLASFERLAAAGNVSHQFLNFVAAMGVAGGRPATRAAGLRSRFATSPFFEWYGADLG